MAEFKVNIHYPDNPLFEFVTRLERLNLDDERIKDIRTDAGFIISEPKSIKKDIKDPDGIFSTKFGQGLQDVNAFANRYKCECGHLTGRIHHGNKCPICDTKVKFVDDNFNYFGWICLKDPFYIIHPNLFKSIEFLFGSTKANGSRLLNILKPIDEKNEDGFTVKSEPIKDEPYYGLGMIGFVESFEEIMGYYLKKYPNKKEYYDDIMFNRSKVFVQSIPVYTTHLRPFKVEGGNLTFEGNNAIYNILAKLAAIVNKDTTKLSKKKKPKNLCLFDIQTKYNELYKEIEDILAQKKGQIRINFGGRYNFTSRAVIAQDPKLTIDQIRLPYHALVELLQQSIINILKKSYNITYSEAYKRWYRAQVEKDQRIWEIIEYLIKDQGGIPILINRNPTISYGGILFMRCIGINDNFTMSIPLQILQLLAADFDGDALNIMYLINKAFIEQADRVFNPRNAMQISRDDGLFNNDINHQRDTLVNANTLVQLSRKYYTKEQLDKIKRLQRMS